MNSQPSPSDASAEPRILAGGMAALPDLTPEQESALHAAASEFVCATVQQRDVQLPDATLGGNREMTVIGAFVSLKRSGRLRGCCGFLGRNTPLGDAIELASRRTATEDTRMPAVSPSELPYLHLETWLLNRLELILAQGEARANEVEIGKHGLRINLGEQAGLLLPSVAIEQGYSAEQFLAAVCTKAGLPATSWKLPECQLFRFEGRSFGGPIAAEAIARGGISIGEILNRDDFRQLTQFCYDGIQHGLRGSASSYFIPGVPDGMVNALAVSLPGVAGGAVHVMRLSLRPGVPLQSTLHAMSTAVAENIKQGSFNPADLTGNFGITVGYDPAMHGLATEPDLKGVDTSERSILVIEQSRTAWMFDPSKSPEALVAMALEQAGIDAPRRANVYSLRTQSTGNSASIVNRPTPVVASEIRSPAVAGTFYPADATEMSFELDALFPPSSPSPARYRAALLPHAGWQFSGKIAAATLARIAIPDSVIVLGPKHTALGVDMAIAPHAGWEIPGATVDADISMAHTLVDCLPGFELDAAAHAREHGIEVMLPMIHRLAPQARVTGVVMSAASFDQCERIASGLARVLKQHPDVLLLISSDMNHYASDAENRRLDELAIAALTSLDPQSVYETCQQHKISMCGRVPAVVALLALKQLKKLRAATRVAYGTSADVSGQTDRVVGYCGMLFR